MVPVERTAAENFFRIDNWTERLAVVIRQRSITGLRARKTSGTAATTVAETNVMADSFAPTLF
jgi:hypothetical protein